MTAACPVPRANSRAASKRRASNAATSRRPWRVLAMLQHGIVPDDDHQSISRESLVAPGAPGAAAQGAERAERVEALVAVRPCHAEAVGLLLDVLGPAHGLGQRCSRLDRVGGIVEAQPREGTDARAVVGRRASERGAAEQ